MQLRHMEIVQDVDKLKVDIQKTCMQYKTIKQWAYICHDKDDTRPHYHIYLNFSPSSCDTKMVAEWFKLAYTDENGQEHTGEQFIEKVKGRKTDVLLYLIHANDSQKFKHQYLPSEVISNFDFQSEIATAKIVGDFENYSYAQMLAYINTLPVDEKGRVYTKLKKLWELRCQLLTLETDRKIDVMFICGKAGTGKTYYAKKLLNSLNYDYCVSSSANDPFQDYLGQKAILLDDLRDEAFEFEDLLKILDNNTCSSVRSRFSNKVFNGELIIITSSVPLHYWYREKRMSNIDPLTQLYRRITCYVEVATETITLYDCVGEDGKPTGKKQVFKNEIQKLKTEKKQKTDFGSAFGNICEREVPPKPILIPIEQEEIPF